MRNFKYFMIGIFYLIPTLMMVFLAYMSFVEMEDYGVGIIAIFGTIFLGMMSYKAFSFIEFEIKETKKNYHPINTTITGNDVPLKDLLVQKRPEVKVEEKKQFCTNCGKEIEKEWKFCRGCGNEIK